MTQVFLHIGLSKCASSTIQRFMYKNDKRNLKQGFCYPVAGRSPKGFFSHSPMVRMEASELNGVVNKVKSEAEQNQCHSIFISAEQFSAHEGYMSATSTVVKRLNALFGEENVHLVMCVRNHFNYVESAYAQFLRGGIFKVPHKEVFNRPESGIVDFVEVSQKSLGYDFFSYSQVIKLISEYTEKKEIEIYSIERPDLNGLDIIDVLINRFELTRAKKIRATNRRFSEKSLIALNYSISKFGFKMTNARRSEIVALFEDQGKGHASILKVSGELFERIKSASERDKSYFSNRFSGNFDSVFSVPPMDQHMKRTANDVALSEMDKQLVDNIFCN